MSRARIENAPDRHRVPWVAEDNGFLASNFDPALANNGLLYTGGFVTATRIWIPETITVTNLVVWVPVAGATLTADQNWGGLYRSDNTLLAKTASQHTAWQSTGLKTMALTAEAGQSLTIPGGQGTWIYAALLANGTTKPSFGGRDIAGASTMVNLNNTPATGYRSAYQAAGGLTALPATLGALLTYGGPPWFGLS